MISKKKYTKPQVEKMDIDHEISLVMMTGGPPGDPTMTIERSGGVKSQSGNAVPPSGQNDPFGGSTPDYK